MREANTPTNGQLQEPQKKNDANNSKADNDHGQQLVVHQADAQQGAAEGGSTKPHPKKPEDEDMPEAIGANDPYKRARSK